MDKLPISKATEKQLRAFATDVLQLDTSKARSKADLLALIGPAWNQDHILVPEEPQASAEQTTAAEPHIAKSYISDVDDRADPIIVINIGQTEMPGGKQPVPVSVNGKAKVIQRGMNVELPYRYYLALVEAKRGSVQQDEQTKAIITSEVTNYPISVIKPADPAAVEAWHKAQAGEELAA